MLIRALVLVATLTAGVAAAGCERSKPPLAPVLPVVADSLQVVRVVALDVREPSDLCLDQDGVHWWTVSDNTGLVYQLRLSDCAVVKTLSYHGVDPEGIALDTTRSRVYVVSDREEKFYEFRLP